MLDSDAFPYPVIQPTFPMDLARMADLDPAITKYCVWHHVGAPVDDDGTAAGTNKYHREEKGYAAGGYHGQIRWNGSVELMRPFWKQGVHTSGYNDVSMAFVFSGNFNLGDIDRRHHQYLSGVAMGRLISVTVPGIIHVRHSDLRPTECPGSRFPWTRFFADIMAAERDRELEEAVALLQGAGIIISPEYWLKHAVKGNQVNGEYAGVVLKRMAATLRQIKEIIKI